MRRIEHTLFVAILFLASTLVSGCGRGGEASPGEAVYPPSSAPGDLINRFEVRLGETDPHWGVDLDTEQPRTHRGPWTLPMRQPIPLEVWVQPEVDLPNTFFTVTLPVSASLVSGSLTWQADLKAEQPHRFHLMIQLNALHPDDLKGHPGQLSPSVLGKPFYLPLQARASNATTLRYGWGDVSYLYLRRSDDQPAATTTTFVAETRPTVSSRFWNNPLPPDRLPPPPRKRVAVVTDTQQDEHPIFFFTSIQVTKPASKLGDTLHLHYSFRPRSGWPPPNITVDIALPKGIALVEGLATQEAYVPIDSTFTADYVVRVDQITEINLLTIRAHTIQSDNSPFHATNVGFYLRINERGEVETVQELSLPVGEE